METANLKLVNLDIDHGKNVLTVAVPEHEINVLRLVHGGDKVRRSEVQEGDTQDFDASADAEYDRLTRKYYRVNAPDLVRAAFPMGAAQLEQAGFVLGREGATKAPASLIKKHPKPAAVVDKKPTK